MPAAYNQLVNEPSSGATIENGVDSHYDEQGKQIAIVLTDIEPTGDETIMMRSLRPKDYLTSAVAVTMCCWLGLPLGIAALIQSRRVRSLGMEGELTQAQEASRKTRTLVSIGLAVGALGWSLVIAVVIIYSLTTEDSRAVNGFATEKYGIFVAN